jgi:Kef-type K+ transport system membrane component KefB
MEETKLVLTLAILIAVAKGAGYVSNWLGQPAVLGELLVGVILGPSVLNTLTWPLFASAHLGGTIAQLAELGVIF